MTFENIENLLMVWLVVGGLAGFFLGAIIHGGRSGIDERLSERGEQ